MFPNRWYVSLTDHAASVGGWRPFTASDYVTYSIVHELRLLDSNRLEPPGYHSNQFLERLLRAHPAYPALSFLRAAVGPACQLIRHLLDPRWFMDPRNGERTKPLYSHFGLDWRSRENLDAILNDRARTAAQHRLRALYDTWAGGQHCISVKGSQDNFVKEFTINCYQEQLESGRGRSEAECCNRAVRRGACLALRFIREVWLDGLFPPRRYRYVATGVSTSRLVMEPSATYAPQLFVPEHFFCRDEERRQWYAHAGELASRC
jgi:hypothetical protein